MASLSSEPGLVWLRPRNVSPALSTARRRSIVAGDTTVSAAATSLLTSSSPKRRNVATSSPITGASRIPVGAPSTAQQHRPTAPPNSTAQQHRPTAPPNSTAQQHRPTAPPNSTAQQHRPTAPQPTPDAPDPPEVAAPCRQARSTRALLDESTTPPTCVLLMSQRQGLPRIAHGEEPGLQA